MIPDHTKADANPAAPAAAPPPQRSGTYTPAVIEDIQAKAELGRYRIRGFGTLKVRKRRSRMARNPRTGDPVEVPSRAVPIFKPSKDLRVQVSDGTIVPV